MRALIRSFALAALVLGGLALAPRAAQAYPQFQLSTGAQRCNQCHIAPAGGTLLSGYGRDEAGETISRGGDGSFLHGAWDPPDWLRLGLDLRYAALVLDAQKGTETPGFHQFPMQGDLYASLHVKDIYASFVLGPRGTAHGRQQDEGFTDRMYSREHYLMWRPNEQGPYVRVGRFQIPYGLRLAEHPTYIRRWGGQNTDEEPYAISGGVVKNEQEWHLSVFTKNPWRCYGQSCATIGGAAYYEKRVGEKTIFGVHARAAFFDETDYGYDHYDGGLVGKYWIEGAKLLFQAQADYGVKNVKAADYMNKEVLGYLGVTYFPVRGLSLTAAGETWVEDVATPDIARNAGSLEIQFFPWAHFEALFWGRMSTDATTLMAQIHYYL
jgi:hypothetical protein